MLLKQLIQQPITSSRLLVCDPFHMPGKEELVKEVIGLANAVGDGPRHILFGINPAALDGNKIVGIGEEATAELKKAHRYVSELVEPVISLAFMFDRINGKLVGALEIDHCDEGPFAVRKNFSKALVRGQSWIRDGRDLREADIAELARAVAHERTQVLDESELFDPLVIPTIDVGFNDDPQCQFIEFSIPDTSDPPLARERQEAKESRNLDAALGDKMKTSFTQTVTLDRWSLAERNSKDSTDVVQAAHDLLGDVDNHYYYEEKALQLNIAVCNKGTQKVNDVRIELGFPLIEDFDIADRIYPNPFDQRSPAQVNKLGYPAVEKQEKGIFVRSTIGILEPNTPRPGLRCALRLAVGPGAQNKKLGIVYTLYRKEECIGQGRLKIRFGKVIGRPAPDVW